MVHLKSLEWDGWKSILALPLAILMALSITTLGTIITIELGNIELKAAGDNSANSAAIEGNGSSVAGASIGEDGGGAVSGNTEGDNQFADSSGGGDIIEAQLQIISSDDLLEEEDRELINSEETPVLLNETDIEMLNNTNEIEIDVVDSELLNGPEGAELPVNNRSSGSGRFDLLTVLIFSIVVFIVNIVVLIVIDFSLSFSRGKDQSFTRKQTKTKFIRDSQGRLDTIEKTKKSLKPLPMIIIVISFVVLLTLNWLLLFFGSLLSDYLVVETVLAAIFGGFILVIFVMLAWVALTSGYYVIMKLSLEDDL